ncbi:uncharacterized protein EV420DRAFT_1765083 [Desarmillaria tabescens]|uniref:Uncharacterized protein n=1 Tax=Armillaria tabescens TaxID=1929756 RepID=A0AA39N4P8_ARMTA|nr:uncharacterized protein EV420DRAFT_1765083 [Desarmillaria tabescens]KAK0457368.1 hypothetical protein EV420DRAFT_1765083 [Desarmillaria tabescens]
MSNEQVSIAPLNQALLGVFCHGIHTCILAFALWAIFSSKQPRSKTRNIMVFLIICLYIFASISVTTNWAWIIYLYIGEGDSSLVQKLYHWAGIALGINAGIADCITIWRCWIIWGRHWPFVILPILLLLAQGVSGCFAFQHNLQNTVVGHSPSEVNWTMIYLSCSLGTTLWCTILIIYRILTVKRYTDDSTGTLTYRRIVEILVESASLYAVGLIGYMVLLTLNVATSFYPQTLYVSITAISPTLIAARVASGNARPNDSWQASNIASSLWFGSAVRSTSMNPDGELTANGSGVDLEHGVSDTIYDHEPESVVNPGQGAD